MTFTSDVEEQGTYRYLRDVVEIRYINKGFELTKEQIVELEEKRNQAMKGGDLVVSNRIRGVLLVGRDSHYHDEAAEMCEVNVRTLRDWLAWYREKGADGLRGGFSTGRPSKLDKEQREELKQMIITTPLEAGLDTGIWTAPVVARLIKERYGVTYSDSQVQRILHRLGFSVQYPKKVLSGADPKAQARWLQVELPSIKKKGGRRKGNPHV